MDKQATIVITGAAGFIASYLTGFLNGLGYDRLILVDDFGIPAKAGNLTGKTFLEQIDREVFPEWFRGHAGEVQYVFHLGARTDTTEMDYEVHRKWNLEYSKLVWDICAGAGIPLLYASSAATYGGGEYGYRDDHDTVADLRPLNPYGQSKQDFDVWALAREAAPPFWAGVKFFNVYGPNEYHKGRMASVIMHAHRQISGGGGMKLFRSHNPAFSDGGQMRDFVYVKDVARMCTWLMTEQPASGLYNVGSGTARTFYDLGGAIFDAMGRPRDISFVDTPADIRDKYQYFTEADMTKLRAAGYAAAATALEDGVREYVQDFLEKGTYF